MKQATGSNSATPSKEMSIRLRSGGHSFPKELPAEYAAADRVVCSVLTHKTLLVPTEVFERESAPNYLALAGLGCAEQSGRRFLRVVFAYGAPEIRKESDARRYVDYLAAASFTSAPRTLS